MAKVTDNLMFWLKMEGGKQKREDLRTGEGN